MRDFDVPAQPAVRAIPELARQAQVQILAPARDLEGITTPAIKGRMDVRVALQRMIAGTPLRIDAGDGQIITLHSTTEAPGAGAGKADERRMRKGSLSGQVLNVATGEYMRNAIVSVVLPGGKRLTTTTGDAGQYELRDLPAGQARVSVQFTGYADQTAEVAIRPDETAKLDFGLRETGREAANEVAGLVVSPGVREGDARAIMAQRQSMNIEEVLSAESYGDIADGNPAEFLKFMPGVDTDGTNGTAVNVYLRGMPPDYTAVTLNGVALASADANTGAGSSRYFSFEALSLAGMDSIQISKTTSADLDANAPAGTINFRTKHAFDRKGRLFMVQLSGATHNDMWDGDRTGPDEGGFGGQKFLPNFQVLYSDSFLDNRLGVVAAVGRTDTYVEREQVTLSRDYKPTAKVPYPLALTAIAPETEERETSRLSATFNVDFKATDNLVLSLMTLINRGTVYQGDITPTFTTGARSSGVSGDPLFDFTTQQAATAKAVAITNSVQYKHNNGNIIIPRFEWKGDHLAVDGYAAYSDASSYYSTPDKNQVVSLTSSVTSTGNFSAQRSSDLYGADWAVRQTSGADWSQPSAFTLSGTPTLRTTNGSTAAEYLKSGAINVTWDTKLGAVPVVFKTGFKVQHAEYDFNDTSDANLYQYAGPLTNAQFLAAIQSENQVSQQGSGGSVDTLSGAGIYIPSMGKLYDLFTQNPGDWRHTVSATNWYNANVANYALYRENTAAIYVMGTADLTDKLKLQAGVRWERTATTTLAFDPLTSAQVSAAGYAVSTTTGLATTIPGLQYQYFTNPQTKRHGEYDYFFPSASLKYSFDRSTDLQIGYSRTILRPEADVLSGIVTVDDVNRTVTEPNPGLQPAVSDNFSVRLARYFEPVGIIGVNFYMNRVKGLFQQQELTAQEAGYTGSQYADYTFVTTTTAGGDAVNIHGYEFEFSHSMSYLPSPFDGLSLRGSFMFNKPDIPIVRVADRIATGSISYKKGPVSLHLNAVWTGDKYRSTTPSWFAARWDVDLSGSVRLRRGLEAFFSVQNLLDQPYNVIVPGSLAGNAIGNHSAIYVDNGVYGSIGVRYTFQ